jgi:hypothetical protein
MVQKCPTCNSDLAGHQFAEVAAAVCEKKNVPALTKFFECARNREWVRLLEFREFKGDCDDLVANVIACSGGGAVIVLKSVFELYKPDELLLLEPITQDDVRVLKTLISADNWQTIKD